MPDTPAAAGFLSDEEKDWAQRRMRMDAHGSTEVNIEDEKASWYWVKMALKAPQTYFCSFIWFFLLIPLYVGLSTDFSLISIKLISSRAFHCFCPASFRAWVIDPRLHSCLLFHQTWPRSSRSLSQRIIQTSLATGVTSSLRAAFLVSVDTL